MSLSPENILRDMLRLLFVPGLGAVRLRRLLEAFGGPAAAVAADFEALRRVPGLAAGPELEFLASKNWNEQAVETQLERLDKSGAQVIFYWQENYPAYLAQIYDPPVLLFARGALDCLNRPCVAVVGTRSPSLYGSDTARDLSGALARAGFTVVSGLARGIDSLAHAAALDNGGLTAAVLGSGVDNLYPPENEPLVERMLEHGSVVLSEYPLGTPPDGRNFPRRNRIISGLSRGVLVVEAGERSGALITAEYALDQGREVFAVPGDVARGLSHGTNRLIKQGATLVQSVDDILEELGGAPLPGRQGDGQPELPGLGPCLSREERRVFDCLDRQPQHVDELAERSGVEVSQLLGLLLQLQMKRLVREHPGKLYSLG